MATPTYTLIDSTVLGSSASSVTFSGIAADWRDLVLVFTVTSSDNAFPLMRFNSDTGSNYNNIWMVGDGSTAASSRQVNASSIRATNAVLDTTPSVTIIQIMDYTATDKHKSVLIRENTSGSDAETFAGAGRWASTSAITSIVVNASGNFNSGSTFYLYGIEA